MSRVLHCTGLGWLCGNLRLLLQTTTVGSFRCERFVVIVVMVIVLWLLLCRRLVCLLWLKLNCLSVAKSVHHLMPRFETLWISPYQQHPPSPFIISHPESWYSFYRPTEGGRLSRPRHCSKGVQPVPKAVYRSGCRGKHNCLWWDSNLGPLTPQSGMLPLGHWDTANHLHIAMLNVRQCSTSLKSR